MSADNRCDLRIPAIRARFRLAQKRVISKRIGVVPLVSFLYRIGSTI
jgi:hypothetical protein